MPHRVPLSSRPLDFLYFAFLLVRKHISLTIEIIESLNNLSKTDSHTRNGVA